MIPSSVRARRAAVIFGTNASLSPHGPLFHGRGNGR
jgi:hypothetical protein